MLYRMIRPLCRVTSGRGSRARIRPTLPLAGWSTAAAVVLAGCSGGGGGPSGPVVTNDNAILGKVVSTSGSGVPGATVVAAITGNTAAGGGQTTTLSGGTYSINGLYPGVYTVSANTTISGTTYTGSSQVQITPGTINSNIVVEVAPANQQGIIQGTVKNAQGQPVSGVTVLATVPVTPAHGTAATSGMQAITNGAGFYEFPNVPVGGSYTLTATSVGYTNSTATVSAPTAGQTATDNFVLAASSTGATPPAPANVLAASLTQPSSILTPSIIAHDATASATSTSDLPTSVYETIRQIMSPKYAQWSANRQLSTKSTRLEPHYGGFGSYAVEADVYFSESQTANVAGYRIYSSEGNQSLAPYDFLQDPQATVYIDLDPYYVPNTTFNFAVSAIGTNNAESALSNTASMDPLELAVVTSPSQGQTVSNPVTIDWQSIPGAAQYGVFLYNTYPSIGSTAVVQATGLSSSTTSYAVTSTLAPGKYWAIVSAADANSVDVSVSQIVEFTVQ